MRRAMLSISLSGDPVSIMNFLSVQGTIASVSNDCNIKSSSESYNAALGTLIMNFDHPTMMGDYTCNNTINPSLLGWSYEITGNSFTMSLDVRTLFSCMAVTYLVNGPDTLDYFVNVRTVAEGTFNGVVYQAVDKYDTQYPGMTPMTCIGPKGGPSSSWNCAIRMGKSYGIPLFNHFGSNPNYPTKCDCTSGSIQTDATISFLCNKFDFLSGIIVYDISKNTTATKGYSEEFKYFLPLLEVFYVPPPFSAKECNEKVFYPAFAALASQANNSHSYQSTTAATFKNHAWRQSHYNFTSSGSFDLGSLIVWRSFSDFDKSVTPNFFQLTNGACTDVVYHPDAFNRFKTVSWGNLEEDFYRCTQTAENAVFTSLGVSTGTASAIAPVFTMIIIYITMSFMAVLGVRSKEHSGVVGVGDNNNRYANVHGGYAEAEDMMRVDKGEGAGTGADSHVIKLNEVDYNNSGFASGVNEEGLELGPLSPTTSPIDRFGNKAQMKKSKSMKKKKKEKEKDKTEGSVEQPPASEPAPEDVGCLPSMY